MGEQKHRVAHSSGAYEWYTPRAYVEAARQTMGGIDLDPASCPEANTVVQAKRYYTEKDNGLFKAWAGRVFLNPPYRRGLIEEFCMKLVEEYASGNVTEAVLLVNNATETIWFQRLAHMASALRFPRGRLTFWQASTTEPSRPLQGQAILYLGDHAEAFAREFSQFGLVMKLWA